MDKKRIILCSASPRRQMLLKAIGFEFDVRTREIDESFPSTIQREEIAIYLAQKKADIFLSEISDDEIIITADTIVWLNNKMLGKPADKTEAIEMLRELSGNCHTVYTAVCISDKTKKEVFSVSSGVYFRKLSTEEIGYYVDHFNPLDKAGAYGAQECLPFGMNPCSEEEVEFLRSINKSELIEQSINITSGQICVDVIEKIEGSFFDVMGLPVIEVYERLKYFTS